MEKELSYVNGVIVEVASASVNIEDRGYQFGEGVYEVIKVYNGRPYTLRPHFERLKRSAEGIGINFLWTMEELTNIALGLLKKTELMSASIYVQITSGTAPRAHIISSDPDPNLVLTIRKFPEGRVIQGIKLSVLEDIRWKKCWIKSTNLVANIMAKKAVREKGAGEALMYESDGRITEGGSSNFFALINGVLVTPDLNHNILPGITRKIVLELAKELELPYREGEIFLKDLKSVEEAFVTASNIEIVPVLQIDDMILGQGEIGSVTRKLQVKYQERVRQECY